MVSTDKVMTISHIIIALFLSYISWAIVTKHNIPIILGYISGFLSFAILIFNNFYVLKKSSNSTSNPQSGLHFDPNDPKYRRIGGIGGVGWV